MMMAPELTVFEKQVIEDTKAVVRIFAKSGTGENVVCHGILAIIGDADELLASRSCDINIELLDYRGKSFSIADCLNSGSPSRNAIKMCLKEDGGFLVDLRTGKLVAGGVAVQDLRNGVRGKGGMRFMAASAAATLGTRGGYTIKVSEDSCGCQATPLSASAMIETFNFTNQVTPELIDEPVSSLSLSLSEHI